MPNFKPKDIIAILVIVFIGFGKFQGFNGSLDVVLALILGYYFVKRQNGIDNGE